MAGGNGAGNTPDKLNSPWGIYIYNNATFIVDRQNHRVQQWNFGKNIRFLSRFHWIVVDLGASVATTVAGSTSDPGPWAYQLSSPTSITIDPYGFLYIMDTANERIQKWQPGALFGVTVVAAVMSNPYGMAMDPLGNFFIADTSNERVISFGLLCRKSCRLIRSHSCFLIFPEATTTTTARPASKLDLSSFEPFEHIYLV